MVQGCSCREPRRSPAIITQKQRNAGYQPEVRQPFCYLLVIQTGIKKLHLRRRYEKRENQKPTCKIHTFRKNRISGCRSRTAVTKVPGSNDNSRASQRQSQPPGDVRYQSDCQQRKTDQQKSKIQPRGNALWCYPGFIMLTRFKPEANKPITPRGGAG